MVDIHPPPPRSSVKSAFYTLDKSQCLVRIFDPTRHNTTALTFRHYGSLLRFDHQRTCTTSFDEERGIYYAGFALSCCLVEVFGDKRTIEVGNYHVALVELKRDLNLINLCGTPAMSNGTITAISSVPNRELSQSWSRYFYENSAIYTKVDGIIYHNAHNSEKSIALYERAIDALICSDENVIPLSHKSLRTDIRRVAEEHALIVVAY